MTILKKTFFFIFIFFILSFIFLLIIADIFNIKKTIKNIENDHDIIINLTTEPDWKFFPEIKLNFSGKIKNSTNQFYAENTNFSFAQSYKIEPLNFIINMPSFFLEGLEIKNINILGNYNVNNKNINLINVEGKIFNGAFKTSGKINLLENEEIKLKGNLSNLYLNQIFKQLNLANWERIEIRLSADNYDISSKLGSNDIFLRNLLGNIPISGSIYFVTTEEERFSVAFLNLLVEKLLPDYKNLSKSLSQIINNYSDKPVLFKGTLEINNGVVHTTNLSVINNNNKINVNGTYDIINNYFDTKLFFIESEKIIVEAKIEGNLENPKIKIVNENTTFNNEKIKNDLNKVFGDGVNTLIDKLLNLND